MVNVLARTVYAPHDTSVRTGGADSDKVEPHRSAWLRYADQMAESTRLLT